MARRHGAPALRSRRAGPRGAASPPSARARPPASPSGPCRPGRLPRVPTPPRLKPPRRRIPAARAACRGRGGVPRPARGRGRRAGRGRALAQAGKRKPDILARAVCDARQRRAVLVQQVVPGQMEGVIGDVEHRLVPRRQQFCREAQEVRQVVAQPGIIAHGEVHAARRRAEARPSTPEGRKRIKVFWFFFSKKNKTSF